MLYESPSGNVYGMETIDNKTYIYRLDKKNNQVFSCISIDNPKSGGFWVSSHNEAGIKYVARGRHIQYANKLWRDCILGAEECPVCNTVLKVHRHSKYGVKLFCPTCQKFHAIPYKDVR